MAVDRYAGDGFTSRRTVRERYDIPPPKPLDDGDPVGAVRLPRSEARQGSPTGDRRPGHPGQAALSVPQASSAARRRSSVRNAPSRQAMSRASATTATMIVEIALIWGVTPNLIAL